MPHAEAEADVRGVGRACVGAHKVNGGDKEDLAGPADEGSPELAGLPEAIVCCVGAKNKKEAQGASKQHVWRRGQPSYEELDRFRKYTICNPY